MSARAIRVRPRRPCDSVGRRASRSAAGPSVAGSDSARSACSGDGRRRGTGSTEFVIATEAAEDWPTRLGRAAVTDVYEVRMGVEVQPARLAARRRAPEDVTALRTALAGRRTAAAWADTAFVDADIAPHAAVVAAAHNPVLADLFTEFTPVLREGLVTLLDLTRLREQDPATGDDTHTALVEAVAEGDAEEAAAVLLRELEETLGLLRGQGSPE
ncbi:FCD domain-containing protein [Streptomyces sp. NPDC051133]|uniref:FCD domain-containing protein n=1 Tax=Streptomyces sp. NPDC051133 TaxID=3155521 RepID=UPI00344174B2